MISNEKVKGKHRFSELLGTVGTGCGDDTVSGLFVAGCDDQGKKARWEQGGNRHQGGNDY